MRRLTFIIVAVIVMLIVVADSAYSIPAFARKYGFNCNMCHTAFTKLNDFGQRFRDNGYQLPGQEGREKNVFQIAPPLSIRTSTGMMVSHAQDETTAGFNFNGLDLLAAGVLHRNVSFLLIYTPRVDEPAADYTGELDAVGPSQFASLESANIVFSNIVQDALNVRVGRFEPAYHAFSSKRSYYLLQPYEIYTFGTPNNNFVFDDNQFGIEATGHFRGGFKYGAGVVNGTGANPDNNIAKDVYVNLTQTFARGDGQSAGQRVGGFAYYGWQPTNLSGTIIAPSGEARGKCNKPFYRVGGDLSLNVGTLNLMSLMMYGADDNGLNPFSVSEDYIFWGGFARLDWAGLLNNRLISSIMFNWVQPPEYDEGRRIRAYSALVRYYLGDWTAVNVALHLEYTYREEGDFESGKTHDLTALIDFDF
jgi:hypothetical protein